jgi:hypothetical protein
MGRSPINGCYYKVSPTGTYIKPDDAVNVTTPSGWTIYTESEWE